MSYKGEKLNVVDFIRLFEEACAAKGFLVEELSTMTPVPLIVATKAAEIQDAPHVYLSAGIHGDEPAGPLALLELMRAGFFTPETTWTLFPLLNPAGMHNGLRDNTFGIDLNRDYLRRSAPEVASHVRWLEENDPLFDIALCLHEDWEAQGYYIYELNPDNQPSLAREALRAVESITGVDMATKIDGFDAVEGLINPVDAPELREDWPEPVYLLHRHTRFSYTFEAPSAQSMGRRTGAHIAAVTRTLEEWRRRAGQASAPE